MPHITDNPELLLNPEQITAALKASVRSRATESTSKDGVYTREITANDGRYDQDKKGLIAQLRKEILQKDEENRVIMKEKRATDAENAKLLCENNQLFNDAEKKDNTIEALQKANETLQQKAITKREAHQAETRDLKSQLDKTTRELQSRTDRSRDLDIKTQHLKDENASLKDEVLKGAEQQRIIEALNAKLIMCGKSCEAVHAENKKMEEALMIAEHSLANSRVAVNPALTNERQTQTDIRATNSTPQPHAKENSDVRNESITAPPKERCRCDEPKIKGVFCPCRKCSCWSHGWKCQKDLFGYESHATEDDDDVPIPGMISAHEYRTNQLALQKKAGLAKHDA